MNKKGWLPSAYQRFYTLAAEVFQEEFAYNLYIELIVPMKLYNIVVGQLVGDISDNQNVFIRKTFFLRYAASNFCPKLVYSLKGYTNSRPLPNKFVHSYLCRLFSFSFLLQSIESSFHMWFDLKIRKPQCSGLCLRGNFKEEQHPDQGNDIMPAVSAREL